MTVAAPSAVTNQVPSVATSAIIRKIENISVTRPMTHDLFIEFLQKTGYDIDRIEINDVEKDTYYAIIYLLKETDGKTEQIEIDARPSDAIAIAIRAEAPIFVTANVLANGSVSCDTAKDEEEAQEFRDFIQTIKPSDFEKLLKHDKESDQ